MDSNIIVLPVKLEDSQINLQEMLDYKTISIMEDKMVKLIFQRWNIKMLV